MKHEDFLKYQREYEQRRVELYGPLPKTDSEMIAELRAELDGLTGRLKAELVDELRVELERLIAAYTNRNGTPPQAETTYSNMEAQNASH